MGKILISINPEHVEKILDGSKRFEYRTKAAKKDIKSLIIYSTSPMKKVVAEAEIVEVIALSPEELWKETSAYSGIQKEFFDDYFKDRKIAYAYKLGRITPFNQPKALKDYGISYAPQSFIYVK